MSLPVDPSLAPGDGLMLLCALMVAVHILLVGRQAHRHDLMESVVGNCHVEIRGKERHFRVSYANTFDEPVGGLMNVILTEDGQHYQYTHINSSRALVIDIGGLTTDWPAVNPGGEIDYSLTLNSSRASLCISTSCLFLKYYFYLSRRV